jgi:hypothetical protein
MPFAVLTFYNIFEEFTNELCEPDVILILAGSAMKATNRSAIWVSASISRTTESFRLRKISLFVVLSWISASNLFSV